MIVTQRSGLETHEKCPRKWYWTYAYRGRGIERKAVSVPLLTGALIHEPLAEVLSFTKETGQIPEPSRIVQKAQQAYLKVVQERGLLLDSFDGSDEQLGQIIKLDGVGATQSSLNTNAPLNGEGHSSPPSMLASPVAWQVNEQLALIEALVKGWTRVRLPQLLSEYEIVDVEAEQEVQLSSDVLLLTRRDALLRRRQTGEFFVLSFKTTSNPDKTWIEQFRYDQQTISEFVAAEATLKEQRISGQDGGAVRDTLAPVVRGVLVEGLVKGQRKIKWPEDAEPEQWRHNSPLLYHYATPDNPPLPRSFKAGAYWRCEAPHDFRYAKGGVCPGGKSHKISSDYQREMVVQTCGFDFWLDWLQENDPSTLQAQFIPLPAIIRSDYEIERWRKMTISAAREADDQRRYVAEGRDLDIAFPMHTASGNCLRPSRCSCLELCWGNADPEDREQFVPRKFNHPREEELIQIRS